MQVSSTSNNLYIQHGNGEYLHQAVKYAGADKIIEFTDKESGRKVQFYSDDSMQKSLQRKFGGAFSNDNSIVKATGNFEKYLQKMWEFNTKENSTVDNNNDGYLDISEFANAKRIKNIDFDEVSKKVSITLSSFRDNYSTEEQALDAVKKYWDVRSINGDKFSVDENFAALLHVDSNLDAKIEDIEILGSMPPEELINQKGLTLGEKTMLFSLLDEWRKKKEKDNDTISSSTDNINTIKEKDNILNKLLSNEADMSKLSEEEKSVFLQNRKSTQNSETFSMEQLLQMKERLQVSSKYMNTQVNSAQIFSLKL